MDRQLSDIQKPHYIIAHRTPAAFTTPADAAAWETLRDTAFASFLGICRDKTIKMEISDGDAENLDQGDKLVMGRNGKVEGILLQTKSANYTAYETIEGVAQDLLIYSESSQKAIFIPNAILRFNESVVSGETENVPFVFEKENFQNKSDFRTRFDIPQS